MNPQTVFACECQPIVIEGLKRVLADTGEFVIVGTSSTTAEALDEAGVLKPAILLLDHSVGLRAALQLIGDLRILAPETSAVLWVSDLGEMESLRCLQSGARGIVKKTQPVEVLLECLRTVANGALWFESSLPRSTAAASRRGTPRFTPREREIVELVCRGFKNRQIAETLAITPGTVKVHLMHIFEKSGVRDRFELAVQGGRLLGSEESAVAETAAAPSGVA